MKIKIHKTDLFHAGQLDKAREKIEDEVDRGKLKLGDVWLSWKRDDDFLTLEGKDITL